MRWFVIILLITSCSKSRVLNPLKLNNNNLIFSKMDGKDVVYFKEYRDTIMYNLDVIKIKNGDNELLLSTNRRVIKQPNLKKYFNIFKSKSETQNVKFQICYISRGDVIFSRILEISSEIETRKNSLLTSSLETKFESSTNPEGCQIECSIYSLIFNM